MQSSASKSVKIEKKYNSHSSLYKIIMNYKSLYLILLPGILFFVIFNYLPMYGITLAFKQYSSAKGILGSPWVGLDKFKMIWEQHDFWKAFSNTIIIAFLKIFFGFPFPIIIALLINEVRFKKFNRIIQTIYTFPHFLSWVVISGIVASLLMNDGSVNNLLDVLGMERVGFMSSPGIFRFLLVTTEIWKESGWTCIMYLAAIASIDPALYEGATIDGANRWHKILHITWPGIRGLAAVLFILAIGNIMNTGFDQVFNLYSPPVYSSGDIVDTYIYRTSFQLSGDFGYSTAVGLFKGAINCTLLVTANSIIKKFGNSSIL